MRVAVAGALGRMGRAVCAALVSSADLELVAGFDRTKSGRELHELLGLQQPCGLVYDDLEALFEASKPDVIVDFSVYPVTLDVARRAVEYKVFPIIGATGWTDEDRVVFADFCDEQGMGALLAPNFALGAVLMMRFAEEAARYFPTVEIIEFHHEAKLDAPSGTARLTAQRIEKIRSAAGESMPVPIHSVRLRGLIAHQEVLFGGNDEILTLRHDSLSRESFMPGVLLACRSVQKLQGLVVGLENILDMKETPS